MPNDKNEFDINIADTLEETDKKCDSCGAAFKYDPHTSSLLCEYCGNIKQIENDEFALEIDFDQAEAMGNHNWGLNTKTVLCKSCGAEAIYDVLEIASVCTYCGSNHIMEASCENSLAPTGVCGFLVSVKQASENFKGWIKKKWFTPKKAKQMVTPESFKGVYLPYWTFDAETHSSYTAKYGITHTRHDKDGRTVTYTNWYNTSGTYEQFFDDYTVPGTERYDRTAMDRIGAFDTAGSKPYKPEYISGFSAERYTVGLKTAWQRAKEKIKSVIRSSIESQIRRRHHADKVSNLNFNTSFNNLKYKYLLLPIWVSSFTYKGKTYHFMVNGQTGKVGGKAPVSALRVSIAVALGILVLIGLYFILYNINVDTY